MRVAEPTKDATLLRIDFGGAAVRRQAAASLELTFNLVDPGKPARTAQVRVGTRPRHVPGLGVRLQRREAAAASTVRFPAGYDVAVESGTFDSRTKTADGGARCSDAAARASRSHFFAYVSAQRPAAYRETPHRRPRRAADERRPRRPRLDRRPGLGRAHRRALFRAGLPVLAREIGAAVAARPSRSSSRRPSAGRPAATPGCSTPAEQRIEVAYWADHAVVAPRGRARLVQRRRSSRTAGPSEGFASLYAQRAAAASSRSRRHEPEAHGRPSARPRSRSTPGRTPPATDGGATSARRRTATRPRSRSPARSRQRAGDDALQRVWAARERARRRLPARDGRRVRRRRPIPRRSTARPTGAACSTCSRPRPARTSPTCGASGWSAPRRRRCSTPAPTRGPRTRGRSRSPATGGCRAAIRDAHARVAVRRGRAAAGRRADRARAARRDRVAGRSWRADPAAGRPAALPGGRHGRRLARGRGGAQRDAHGHAGRGRPGPRRRPAEPIGMLGEDPEAEHRDGPGRVRRGRPRGRPVGGGRRLSRLDGGVAGGPAARPAGRRPSSRARSCWSRRSRPGRGRRAASGPPPSSRAPDLVMRVTGVAAAFVDRPWP